MAEATHCYIYRSKRKDELYLFLAEEDDFECVPEALRKNFGQLEKAMELDITPESKLARSDTADVIANLKEHGFHIQLPPPNPTI
jgi:uncharacterized protein YcgL (UPF0745 family)